MQAECRGMLHHLGFGRRSVCIDEHRLLSYRSIEWRQLSRFEYVQSRPLLGDDLIAKCIPRPRLRRRRWPLRLSVAGHCHDEHCHDENRYRRSNSRYSRILHSPSSRPKRTPGSQEMSSSPSCTLGSFVVKALCRKRQHPRPSKPTKSNPRSSVQSAEKNFAGSVPNLRSPTC